MNIKWKAAWLLSKNYHDWIPCKYRRNWFWKATNLHGLKLQICANASLSFQFYHFELILYSTSTSPRRLSCGRLFSVLSRFLWLSRLFSAQAAFVDQLFQECLQCREARVHHLSTAALFHRNLVSFYWFLTWLPPTVDQSPCKRKRHKGHHECLNYMHVHALLFGQHEEYWAKVSRTHSGIGLWDSGKILFKNFCLKYFKMLWNSPHTIRGPAEQCQFHRFYSCALECCQGVGQNERSWKFR